MIFPEIAFNDTDQIVSEEDLPLLCEYAFDFKKNEFKLKNGKHYLVTGVEALKVWIYKALKTQRFNYNAYSDDFGSELETLIGSIFETDEKISEVKRFITESLMVNPYILAINEIEIEIKNNGLLIATIDLDTVYEGVKVEWQQLMN